MIEAGTTSTGKVVVLLEVHAPPGIDMVAPLQVSRNVEGRKAKAALAVG
jgi:hypothetical protein